MSKTLRAFGLAIGALALTQLPAAAQTVKIGFISSYSGLNGNLGPYMSAACGSISRSTRRICRPA